MEDTRINIPLPCSCGGEEIIDCKNVNIDPRVLGKNEILLDPFNSTLQFVKLVEGSKKTYFYNNSLVDLVVTYSEHTGGVYGHASLTTGETYVIEFCGKGNSHIRKQFDVQHIGEHLGIDFLDQKIGPVPFGFVNNITDSNASDDNDTLTDVGIDNSTTIATFTIKFYYTMQFQGATADIDGFLEQIVAETNLGYMNSLVPLRAKVLCSELTLHINETISGVELLHVFKNLKGSTAALQGGADVAVLVTNHVGPHICGMAILNGVKTGDTISVVRKDCALGHYSLAHLIGHNMGLHHEKSVDKNKYYKGGQGYLIEKGLDTHGYHTIMAVGSQEYGQIVNFYSNPNVIYSRTGTPTGHKNKAYNAAILIAKRFELAAIGDESGHCFIGILPNTYIHDPRQSLIRSVSWSSTGKYCRRECIQTQDCVAWSFNKRSSDCIMRFLKYNPRGSFFAGNNDNPTFAIKKDPCYIDATYLYSLQRVRELRDIKSADECYVLCKRYERCLYWQWYQKHKRCYMYNNYRTNAVDFVSGTRHATSDCDAM